MGARPLYLYEGLFWSQLIWFLIPLANLFLVSFEVSSIFFLEAGLCHDALFFSFEYIQLYHRLSIIPYPRTLF